MASADPVSSSSILYIQKIAANVCFAYGSIYLSPCGQNAQTYPVTKANWVLMVRSSLHATFSALMPI